MTKFKITREVMKRTDGYIINDDIIILDAAEMENFIINTKDLPDLIKALQDKEKEIDK